MRNKFYQTKTFAAFLLLGAVSSGEAMAVDVSDGALIFSLDATESTAVVSGYSGSEVDVEIPAEINFEDVAYRVVSIGDYAFYGSMVESVILGSNITHIGMGAFYYSLSLSSVTFGENLQSIGVQAFSNCSSLTSIVLPSSVAEIGDYAFMSAGIAGDITLPVSLTSFGRAPFRGCPVTAFTIDSANEEYTVADGVLFSADMSTLVSYPCGRPQSEYEVPAEVRTIGPESMRNAMYLKSIGLQEGVAAIEELAFAADYLTAVKIPSSVRVIERGAFYYNTELVQIEVEPGNMNFEVADGLLIGKEGNAVIAAIRGLVDIKFAEGIQSVGDYVFYGYNGLKSVGTPATLKHIGMQSFYGCPDLEKLNLSDGIESIDFSAFQSCESLQTVEFPASLKSIGKQAFATCIAMEEAILNDGLEEIGQSAFYGCNGLTKVRVPGSAHEFGYSIFYSCENLQEAILEEGLTIIPDGIFNYDSNLSKLTIPSTIKIIDEAALYGTAIDHLDLPDGLTTIGDMAVYGTQIESLDLPDSVETIGEFAFAYNYNLRNVKCGSGLRSIGDNAFSSLPSLESITLNEGLESIGYEGISFCDILPSLEIPSTVTEIGSYAFIGCPLEKLINRAIVPQELYEGEDIVADPEGNLIYDTCTLYVEAESVEAYSDASVWKLFKNIQPLESLSNAEIEKETSVEEIFTIDGRRISSPERGVNILRLNDGTSRKVIMR